VPLAIAACALTPTTALAASVTNGSFETGSFSGWAVSDSGSGNWLINSGAAGDAMAPTEGTRDAYTQQGGPGSHILYQDVVLEAGQQHTLSLDLGYRNNAGVFYTPESLSEATRPNQQARVDIVRPGADVRSVAASDVLLRVFRTEVGTPATRTMAAVTGDLTPFAGQTVRLRIAQVDNQSFFNVTLDKVRITSVSVDADGDGVVDTGDNCPADANADQANLDQDARGDACDDDIDGDGALNGDDFAPRDAGEQTDSDGDGVGDNADRFPNDATETADADDDGVGDRADNCKIVANAGQADLDADGRGDACDDDVDGDGVTNGIDNAPRDPNADQLDLDQDGLGDVIDTRVLPMSAEMCKKDAFKRFYDGAARFKNQGDCVSFVATGGKNLPAGS